MYGECFRPVILYKRKSSRRRKREAVSPKTPTRSLHLPTAMHASGYRDELCLKTNFWVMIFHKFFTALAYGKCLFKELVSNCDLYYPLRFPFCLESLIHLPASLVPFLCCPGAHIKELPYQRPSHFTYMTFSFNAGPGSIDPWTEPYIGY